MSDTHRVHRFVIPSIPNSAEQALLSSPDGTAQSMAPDSTSHRVMFHDFPDSTACLGIDGKFGVFDPIAMSEYVWSHRRDLES